MKIIVDRQRCDGNGVCMGIAPEIFDVDDDLYLHVAENIPDDLRLRDKGDQLHNRGVAGQRSAGHHDTLPHAVHGLCFRCVGGADIDMSVLDQLQRQDRA